MLDTLSRALVWADSHGLTVPVILGALTVVARLVWAGLRPTVERRWPGAVPVVEGAAARVAALLPDVLAAILRRRPAAPSGRSGEAGRATVATLVLLALVGVLGLAACPGNHPHYCAPSRELTPIGDEPCSAQGRVCALDDAGVASCEPPR